MSEELTPTSSAALKRRFLNENTKVILPVGLLVSGCFAVVVWLIGSYAGRIEAVVSANIEQDKRIQALEINASYTQQSLQTIKETTESIKGGMEKLSEKIDELRRRP